MLVFVRQPTEALNHLMWSRIFPGSSVYRLRLNLVDDDIRLCRRESLRCSGCLSIDAALGVGGFPRGRVIEIYGPESGGKTTLTLQMLNGQLVCVPDNPRRQDATALDSKAAAYADYDREMANAWRGPNR